MNTCEHYRLQISQLLDGELPEAQQQTLRAHLHTCPDCQRCRQPCAARLPSPPPT